MCNKVKVIIDTDPGIDDLLALAIAAASPELDVLAFSTVHGNVSLEKTSRNALLISDILKLNIPVYKGSSKPLYYDKKEVTPVHGPDGLGNLYNEFKLQMSANVELSGNLNDLNTLINDTEEQITIIALGPLTNIAKLILLNENFKDHVKEIHIMGGGIAFGNINELTEFNFYSDSHAAKIVMNSGIPIILSTLDLTHKLFFENNMLTELREDNPKLRLIKESVEYYAERDPYMHDVCTVVSLTHPEFFTYTEVDVDVIVGGGIADGLSYIKKTQPVNNTKVADTSNRKEIIDYIIRLLNESYK